MKLNSVNKKANSLLFQLLFLQITKQRDFQFTVQAVVIRATTGSCSRSTPGSSDYTLHYSASSSHTPHSLCFNVSFTRYCVHRHTKHKTGKINVFPPLLTVPVHHKRAPSNEPWKPFNLWALWEVFTVILLTIRLMGSPIICREKIARPLLSQIRMCWTGWRQRKAEEKCPHLFMCVCVWQILCTVLILLLVVQNHI